MRYKAFVPEKNVQPAHAKALRIKKCVLTVAVTEISNG